MNKYAFGRRIHAVRREQGLTSNALDSLCKVNPVFIRQIESAARLPSLPNLVVICNKLHVLPAHLLADSLETNGRTKFDQVRRTVAKAAETDAEGDEDGISKGSDRVQSEKAREVGFMSFFILFTFIFVRDIIIFFKETSSYFESIVRCCFYK